MLFGYQASPRHYLPILALNVAQALSKIRPSDVKVDAIPSNEGCAWVVPGCSPVKPMYILGLSSFSHESSCALIRDGEIVFLIEEERLNREKHTSKFPEQAVRAALAQESISLAEVDAVTFFWVPLKELAGNLKHVVKFFPQSLHLLTAPSGGDDLTALKRLWKMRTVGRELSRSFGSPRDPRIHFVEHHLCHAASAFFVSPFDESAILTIDGRGESTTTMMARGQGSTLEKLQEVKVPHSLGHLYATVTAYLGFRPLFDEWKVMGMSAYGQRTQVDKFERLVRLKDDGGFELDLDFFQFHTHGQKSWFSPRFVELFGPPRQPKDPYQQEHFDLALALQLTVEKAGVHLAKSLQRSTGLDNLCMTGGVVLNCLMNKRIVEESGFKNFFFQPIANDAGTSLGSALYHYHHVLGKPRTQVFDSVYLGHGFSSSEVEKVLKAKGVSYRKSDHIARDTAQHIAAGKIVGWFQGRMEAGPRALGNRSITVDPRDATMKDRLNERVKKREFFRPFAPSVIAEKADEYFDIPKGQDSPYMILIGDVREEKKHLIPAVTHNDGTARVHTVRKDVNPRYWELIHEFGQLTGIPVIINTSFNENEPIVCTPEHAVDCFLRTEFDVLAIDDFLVEKTACGKKASDGSDSPES